MEQTKISIQKLQESFDLDTQRIKFEREMEMKLAHGELQQSENTVSTLQQKLRQKESEGAEIEQSINDLKTRANYLESMVASLHSSLSSKDAEFRNNLEKETEVCNHLKAKVLDYESVITELETKLSEAQKMVQSSIDELSNKDHLLALEAKKNRKLKEDIEELHSDLLDSESSLKQKQDELDISNNSRQIVIAQVTELSHAKQLLDEELKKSSISIKALEITTQEQVAQLKLFEAMVSKLSTEKEHFSLKSERLSHDLDAECKNNTSLKESCAKLKVELDGMKAKIDELIIISNQKAEQARQNEDLLMKQNQSLAVQNEVFASLVSSLKNEISNIKDISDIKSNEIVALTSRLNDLTGIENSLKLEVKNLTSLVQSLELEVKQLGERIVAEQTNFAAQLTGVSKIAEAKEYQLQSNISNLETELSNAKIDLEQCQKELYTAQESHEKDRTYFTTKEMELQLHLSSLDQKLNSITTELVLLKAEKENADQHIKVIEQKLASTRVEAQTAIETNSQLSHDLEKLNSSYQELKEKQQAGISETLKLTNQLENDSSFLRRIISSDAKVAKLILRLFFEIGKLLKVTIPWTLEEIQEFPARVESSINSLPDPVILQMDEKFGLQIIEAIKKIIMVKIIYARQMKSSNSSIESSRILTRICKLIYPKCLLH